MAAFVSFQEILSTFMVFSQQANGASIKHIPFSGACTTVSFTDNNYCANCLDTTFTRAMFVLVTRGLRPTSTDYHLL